VSAVLDCERLRSESLEVRLSDLTLRDRLGYGVEELVREVGKGACGGEFFADHRPGRVSPGPVI